MSITAAFVRFKFHYLAKDRFGLLILVISAVFRYGSSGKVLFHDLITIQTHLLVVSYRTVNQLLAKIHNNYSVYSHAIDVRSDV